MPFLAIGAAVGGGILNTLAGNAERDKVSAARQRALSLLKENIIDADELGLMLRNVNRLFNNRLVNTLNSTALQSRGYANSNVAKGVVAGAMEGSRLQALQDTSLRVEESNQQTRQTMAGVESSMIPQGTGVGDFLGGAIAGAQTGMEISKMLAPKDLNLGTLPQAGGGFQVPEVPSPMGGGSYTNPFLGKLNIEDDDIYGFQQPSAFNRLSRGF